MSEWVLKGECNHCGWCCQFHMLIRLTVPSKTPERLTPDLQIFYSLRGAVKGDDGRMRLIVHGFAPCSAHDNGLVKRCTIYEDRPQVCRDFPQAPDQLEGTPCSYWFERTLEDGTIERRGGLDSPWPSPPVFPNLLRDGNG